VSTLAGCLFSKLEGPCLSQLGVWMAWRRPSVLAHRGGSGSGRP
jgi:hypothetical protein